MAADQKDDQRVFQAKQRELLMAVKDLSKHAILADAGELEDQLERGSIALTSIAFPSLYFAIASSLSQSVIYPPYRLYPQLY